jgi:TolA-binding protein
MIHLVRQLRLHILVAVSVFVFGAAMATHAQAPAPAASSPSDVAFTAATQLFTDGKYPDALAALQKFERDFKFSTALPQVIYYEGWCWFNLRRYTEASNVFDRLLKTYPAASIVPETILKRAECFRELKNYPVAAGLYHDFQVKFPKHELMPQAMLGEAWMRYRQKDLAGAKVLVQGVRDQFPDNAVTNLDALFLLGQIFNDEKNFDGARALYKQIAAQRANPRATEGLYLAGQSMYEAGRYADAITYFQRVDSKAQLLDNIQTQTEQLRASIPKVMAQGGSPADVQARIQSLDQLADQIRKQPDLRTLALLRIANCYQQLAKPQEAAVVYRYLLVEYPADKLAEDAEFGLIQTLTESGRSEEANAETEQFKKNYPKSLLLENASFVQAEALYGSKQYQHALDHYLKFRAAAKDPQLIESTDFRIAACYYGLGQYDKALDAFAAFIQEYPQSKSVPDALFRLGRAHFEIADKSTDPKIAQPALAEAIKDFEKILAAYPESELLPDVTFQLGYLYSYLGAYDKDASGKLTNTANFDKAIASFQDFVKRWPDHQTAEAKPLAPEAVYQIARNQFSLQHYDDAIASYKDLIQRYPDSELAPFAAYEIGTTLYTAHKPAEMIAAFRDYATKYPNHAHVGDALYAIGSELEEEGNALAAKGQTAEAAKRFDDAVAAYRDVISRAASADKLSDQMRNAAVAAEVRIAAMLVDQNKLKDAVTDYLAFLAKFASDPVAARQMVGQIAELYRKAKLLPDAYAALDQLTTQYQQNSAIRIAAVTSAIELALGEKDFARASAAAQKLSADPEKDKLPAVSYLAIGNAYLKTEHFDEARASFQKLLSLYPDETRTLPAAQVGLGNALLGLKNYDEAEAAFNKMIAATPQSPARPDADLGLAKVYEARGAGQSLKAPGNVKAVDLFNSAMRNGRGDTSFEAAYHLGTMFFNAKDDPQKEKDSKKLALAYFLRLLFATGPMAEEAAYRTGQCQEALGNAQGACNAYQAYERRFPNGTFAQDAKAKVASLCAPAQS